MIATFWVIVWIHFAGQEPKMMINQKIASIEACLEYSKGILSRSLEVKGEDGFEIQVTCSVVRAKELSASEH
jgi:hypothetical protein